MKDSKLCLHFKGPVFGGRQMSGGRRGVLEMCFSAVRRGTILDWVPSVRSVVCAGLGWAATHPGVTSHNHTAFSVVNSWPTATSFIS